MGRRGEAPLAVVVLHAAPLGVQIQRQRARTAFAGGQLRFAGNHEGKARHALNAFVGGAYQVINIQRGDIQWNAAEAAHRIDDIAFIVPFRQFGHLFDRIQHTGGGFAVYHRDMGDRRVVLQDLFDRGRVRTGDFAAVVRVAGDAHQLRHLNHTRAIGAIADDQHFALFADDAAEHRFDRVAAATLQQHCGITVGRGSQLHQLLANGLYHAEIVIIIPGAAIEQHRLFHRTGGG